VSDAKDDDEEETKGPPRGFAVGAYGLAIFFACRLLEIFLEAQATASAVGQAVLVEWASSRLGVAWTDPKHEQTKAQVGKRAALGLAIGVAAALELVVVLFASHAATFESVAAIPASMIVIGVITAGLHAWRDELLLHGIVLRALGLFDLDDESGRPHDLFRVMACGATSAGAALGRSDASARTVVVAALLGILFGALWVRDRGAWMPWAAHTAFRFLTDTLLAGGIVQMRLAAGGWAGGDSGVFSGTAAVVALAPVALLAIAVIVRRISPDSTQVG
jgi:hypothetical protein